MKRVRCPKHGHASVAYVGGSNGRGGYYCMSCAREQKASGVHVKRQLNISIDCGPTTCASAVGKFCQFVGTTHFGKQHVCRLFPSDEGATTALRDEDGWLQRCQACLDAEEKQ